MKPSEFWTITLTELVEMVEAVMSDEKDRIEVQQELIAWQTSLLMNSTGNYKKKIKPEDLLGKAKDTEVPDGGKGVSRVDRDVKNKKIDELKKKFEKPLAE